MDPKLETAETLRKVANVLRSKADEVESADLIKCAQVLTGAKGLYCLAQRLLQGGGQ